MEDYGDFSAMHAKYMRPEDFRLDVVQSINMLIHIANYQTQPRDYHRCNYFVQVSPWLFCLVGSH